MGPRPNLPKLSASFTERGEHELKGIDGSWRLFSVSA